MITVTFISADGESQEVQAVDGQSLLDLAQAAIPAMQAAGEGWIVNLSSGDRAAIRNLDDAERAAWRVALAQRPPRR